MGGQFRFLVVDDHPIFREGLVAVVESNPRYKVCAQAGTVGEALAVLGREPLDLALVDLSLGGQSGLELVKIINSSHPEILCIVVSIHDEAVYAERALKARARAYVMKQEAGEVLLTAIQTVLSGRIYLAPAMTERLEAAKAASSKASTAGIDLLTDRELQVLEHIGKGFGATELAARLNLSVKTVSVYQDHIKRKLGLQGATELRRFAVAMVQSRL